MMQDQFAQALEEREHEKACFCLRSMIVHAASDFKWVWVNKSVSVLLCVVKIECATCLGLTPIAKRSDVCLGQRCRVVRRSGCTCVQFCEKKEYHVQTRRAKRVYTKYQKAAFLDKLFNKNPELHAMLRQPKCTQPTTLTQPVWNDYLNGHLAFPSISSKRCATARSGGGEWLTS